MKRTDALTCVNVLPNWAKRKVFPRHLAVKQKSPSMLLGEGGKEIPCVFSYSSSSPFLLFLLLLYPLAEELTRDIDSPW